VIVTATRATEPLFDGRWSTRCIRCRGGSSKPAARELDDALLTRAELIVVEWLPAAQTEAGEFVRAASGVIDSTRVTELGKLLVRGTTYDRRSGDIVVYKSVGIGLEDVALAHLVYSAAANGLPDLARCVVATISRRTPRRSRRHFRVPGVPDFIASRMCGRPR